MKKLRRKKGESPQALVIDFVLQDINRPWDDIKFFVMDYPVFPPITEEEVEREKETYDDMQRMIREETETPQFKKGHCSFIKRTYKFGMDRSDILFLLKEHGYDINAGGVTRILAEKEYKFKKMKEAGLKPKI